jgi:hypothetical protein
MFSPDGWRNKPLADDAPLDPLSATMAAAVRLEFQTQMANPDVTKRPVVNTYWCTPRVYTVPAGQPTVQVTITGPSKLDPNLLRQFAAVPIPPDAEPDENCSDHNMVVYQPSTDSLWEFFLAKKDGAGQWFTDFGGKIGPDDPGMLGVSQNPGHWMDKPAGYGRYGASASSIAMMSGLQRTSELQAGAIDHVVSFAMNKPKACFRYPAQRQDGHASQQASPLAPPMGSILRLPASLNVDALAAPAYTKMLARAVQRYGMVLQDRSSKVAFYAEHPKPGAPDPYGAIFAPANESDVLRTFPWDKLQVLAAPPGTNACQM